MNFLELKLLTTLFRALDDKDVTAQVWETLEKHTCSNNKWDMAEKWIGIQK